MGYLAEFRSRLNKRDFSRVKSLWDEYLECDEVDVQEVLGVLREIQRSDLKVSFGEVAESGLGLLDRIHDEECRWEVLLLLFDLQTTNSAALIAFANEELQSRYGHLPEYKDWVRVSGIRTGEDYQGVLRKFRLLSHMSPGRFVYHVGGLGTGEIMQLSFVREELHLEFENVGGEKVLSFSNAFKVLEPLESSHFYARRFFDPDVFEQEAKSEPLATVKLLLEDLGPKTAQEIKDELFDLVIPERDWAKWWQNVRGKLKKDPLVKTPEGKDKLFAMRRKARSLEEQLQDILSKHSSLDGLLPVLYAFVRDLPEVVKDEVLVENMQKLLTPHLESESTPLELRLQISLFFEQFFQVVSDGYGIKDFVCKIPDLNQTLDRMSILAMKKRVLEAVRDTREEWTSLFIASLHSGMPTLVRDYILKELIDSPSRELISEQMTSLLSRPQSDPELFLWYFNKVLKLDALPYADQEGSRRFLESLFILLNAIEFDAEYKDQTKKIYQLITQKRFKLVRDLIKGAPREYLQEFLLLASKCQTFAPHEQGVLRSLAAVQDASFAQVQEKVEDRHNPEIFWALPQAIDEVKRRIERIGTVEMVENAKEIEEARALGDLRENAEFKFAQERRRRLQHELKSLSDQLQLARPITEADVSSEDVGIGSVVELETLGVEGSSSVSYTILGVWDANPEENILSIRSQLAQSLLKKRSGETIDFKDETRKIVQIETIFSASCT